MGECIPISIPNFEGNEKKYVDDALKQGWVSTGGAYIIQFEKELAGFLKTGDVAACQSGTAALHLSLVDAGVQAGDVVLVPSLTFVAAVNPVKYQQAVPVFMDCDDSLCMDPIKLRDFCEEECKCIDGVLIHGGRIVKAVVIVHVFGNMADMESIMDIAASYNLTVIEDATEALGTNYTEGRYAGKYAGTIGHYGAYSFNGNKIITTGGGGAVTARDASKVAHLRYLSTQAKDDPNYYIHNEIGYNYRMTNLQAALGVAQMEELSEFIRRKQKNYEIYKAEFADFHFAKILPFREGTSSNQWFYSLLINRDYIKASIREIITALESKGIQTRAIWGLINEQKPYKEEMIYRLEKSQFYAERILNLPCGTQITEKEIRYVCNKVKRLLTDLARDADAL